jgi:hypothetical protein
MSGERTPGRCSPEAMTKPPDHGATGAVTRTAGGVPNGVHVSVIVW